jgi:hypothetical protein
MFQRDPVLLFNITSGCFGVRDQNESRVPAHTLV